jgi:hypothetical protein
MAVFTLDLGIKMFALQDVICFSVVKLACIELRYMGIATLMLGMAFLAFFGFFDVTVVGVFICYVFGYVFVTVFAEAGLCRLIKFLMAFRTFTFNFTVTLYNVTRRQDVRDRVGLRVHSTNQ